MSGCGAGKLRDGAGEIENAGWRAGADVEHRRVVRRTQHRSKQRGDDVGDEDEVAGLFAVAEHLDRRAAGDAFAEDGDHAGIRGARVLARAIDVEETQARGGDAVHVAGDARMQFAGIFVGSVGGERAADSASSAIGTVGQSPYTAADEA